jgi:hypothetical protein
MSKNVDTHDTASLLQSPFVASTAAAHVTDASESLPDVSEGVDVSDGPAFDNPGTCAAVQR